MTTLLKTAQKIIYPETDGLPLSDNTKQLRLIMTTQGGLDALYQNEKVFVTGNLLWLPVEGSGESKAPDVMVIFGQDKRDRTSYKQWEEGNLGPQVAFEFVSKNNSVKEVEVVKLDFYKRHGVDEYYIHDPDKGTLKGWTREGTWFQPVPDMNGWVSPLMGIRFELIGKDMQLYHPDGRAFETYPEIMKRADRAESELKQKDSQIGQERHLREQVESQLKQKDNQLDRARTELEQAALQLEQERQQRRKLAERLSSLDPEQLRALGLDPDMLS